MSTNEQQRRAGSSGWTAERRARAAEAIRRWQPWRFAHGPATPAGKARSAQNALKHGARSAAMRTLSTILADIGAALVRTPESPNNNNNEEKNHEPSERGEDRLYGGLDERRNAD